ncbi:MAG: hypothetical protein IT184_12495 [Acidobacteria bacterium]|nr:hypothetical protein [Acidobacteriota bacterium]
MIAAWGLLIWLALGAAPQERAASGADLTEAKALYAAGSYEEALAKLSAIEDLAAVDEADQYRALCLLALGRTTETEQSLESLVKRRPLFRMSEADVSPRLVTMFHAVRKRVLPETARTTYVRAKRSFDQKDFEAAAADLKILQRLLTDEDMDQAANGMTDLGMLADGFLKLAEAELATKKPAPSGASPPAVAAAAPTPARAPGTPEIYSIADADVIPAVEVSRRLPPWRPPNAAFAARELRGILRLTINEGGQVESASLAEPIGGGYDPLLLDAAKQWVFRPATKAGTPVRYSKDVPIILAPSR